jgi:hypothetical protein
MRRFAQNVERGTWNVERGMRMREKKWREKGEREGRERGEEKGSWRHRRISKWDLGVEMGFGYGPLEGGRHLPESVS